MLELLTTRRRPFRAVSSAVALALLVGSFVVGREGPAASAAPGDVELVVVESETIVLDLNGDIASGTDLSAIPNQCGQTTQLDTVICIGDQSTESVFHEGTVVVGGLADPVNDLVAAGGEALPALEWIVDEAVEAIPVMYDLPSDSRIRAYGRPQIQAFVHARLLDIMDRYIYGIPLTANEQRALDFVNDEVIRGDMAQTEAAYAEYQRFTANPCAYSPPIRPAYAEAVPVPDDVREDCEYAKSFLQVAVDFAPPVPSVEHFRIWGAHSVGAESQVQGLAELERQRQILEAANASLILASISAAVGVGVIAGILVGASATLSLVVAAYVGSMAVVAAGVSYLTGSMAAAAAVAAGFAATGVGAIVAALILVGIALTVGITRLNERASIGQTLKADVDSARSADPLGLEALRDERSGQEIRTGYEEELPAFRGAEFGERLFGEVVEWTSITPAGTVIARPDSLWTPNFTDDADHRFRTVGPNPEILDSITIRDSGEGMGEGPVTVRFDDRWMILTHDSGVDPTTDVRFTDPTGQLVQVSRTPADAAHPGGRFLVTPVGEGVAPIGAVVDTLQFFDPAGELVEVELIAPSAEDPAAIRPTAVGPLTASRAVSLRPNPVNGSGVAVPEDHTTGWTFDWTVSLLNERTGTYDEVHGATEYGTTFTPSEPGIYRAEVTMIEDVPSPAPGVDGVVHFRVTSPEIEITRLDVIDDGYSESTIDLEIAESVSSDVLTVSVRWPGDVDGALPALVERAVPCQPNGVLDCTAHTAPADRAALALDLTDSTDLHGDVVVTVTNSTGGTASRTVNLGGAERPTLATPPGGTADGTEFDPRRSYVEVEVGDNPLTEIARVTPGEFNPNLPVSLGIGAPGSGQSASSITPLGGLLFVSLVEDQATGDWVLAISGSAEVAHLGLHSVPIVIGQADATGPGRALHVIDLNVVPATGDRHRAFLDNVIDPLGPPLATVPALSPVIYGGVSEAPDYTGEMCVRLVRAATAYLMPTICDDASRFVDTEGTIRFPFEELQPDGIVANSIYRASAWLTDTDRASDTPHLVSFQVESGPPSVTHLDWDADREAVIVQVSAGRAGDVDVPITSVDCEFDGSAQPCDVDAAGGVIALPGLAVGNHTFGVTLFDLAGNYTTASVAFEVAGQPTTTTTTTEPDSTTTTVAATTTTTTVAAGGSDARVAVGGTLQPGGLVDIVITSPKLLPNHRYQGVLRSTPVDLGSQTASDEHTLTFAGVELPADWTDGTHSVTVYDTDGLEVLVVTFQAEGATTSSTTSPIPPATPTGSLPATGGGGSPLPVALLALLIGLALLLLTRRRGIAGTS